MKRDVVRELLQINSIPDAKYREMKLLEWCAENIHDLEVINYQDYALLEGNQGFAKHLQEKMLFELCMGMVKSAKPATRCYDDAQSTIRVLTVTVLSPKENLP